MFLCTEKRTAIQFNPKSILMKVWGQRFNSVNKCWCELDCCKTLWWKALDAFRDGTLFSDARMAPVAYRYRKPFRKVSSNRNDFLLRHFSWENTMMRDLYTDRVNRSRQNTDAVDKDWVGKHRRIPLIQSPSHSVSLSHIIEADNWTFWHPKRHSALSKLLLWKHMQQLVRADEHFNSVLINTAFRSTLQRRSTRRRNEDGGKLLFWFNQVHNINQEHSLVENYVLIIVPLYQQT